MSAGDYAIFFTRPLCLVLLLASAAVLVGAALKLAPKQLRQV
jgi:TctA family transporter